jgi:hypothetical protein
MKGVKNFGGKYDVPLLVGQSAALLQHLVQMRMGISCHACKRNELELPNTRPFASWFDDLDIMAISENNWLSAVGRGRERRDAKSKTYPRQTLPAGFPFPPEPPLESY